MHLGNQFHAKFLHGCFWPGKKKIFAGYCPVQTRVLTLHCHTVALVPIASPRAPYMPYMQTCAQKHSQNFLVSIWRKKNAPLTHFANLMLLDLIKMLRCSKYSLKLEKPHLFGRIWAPTSANDLPYFGQQQKWWCCQFIPQGAEEMTLKTGE